MNKIFEKIENKCGLKIIDKEEIESVRTGKIFRIIDNNGQNWAIKITDRDQVWGDIYFYEKLAGKNIVKVPKVIFFEKIDGEYVIVMEWLEGNEGIEVDYKLGRDIGEKLFKIHQIEVGGCGQKKENGWEYKSWDEFLRIVSADRFRIIEQTKINKNIKAKIGKKFDEGLVLANSFSDVCLCHGDVGMDNMMFVNGKLDGLIDTGWIVGGDGLTDVAYLINGQYRNKEFINGVCDSYGITKSDPRLVFYQTMQFLGKVDYYTKAGKNDRLITTIDNLIELVNR